MIEVKVARADDCDDTFIEVQNCDGYAESSLEDVNLFPTNQVLTTSAEEAKAEINMVYVLPIDFLAKPD